MSDEECIHGLGPVTACVICNGRAERERAEQASAYRVFPAKYEGICDECRGAIDVDDDIAWRPDHPVVHAGCLTINLEEGRTPT